MILKKTLILMILSVVAAWPSFCETVKSESMICFSEQEIEVLKAEVDQEIERVSREAVKIAVETLQKKVDQYYRDAEDQKNAANFWTIAAFAGTATGFIIGLGLGYFAR